MAIESKTPVPTPNGWVLASDLRPGDVIFKARGGIQTIGSVQSYIPGECYRVTFDDGTFVVGDKHARLAMQDRRWRSKQQQWFGNQGSKFAKKKFRRPLTVKSFAEIYKEPLVDARNRKRWSVQTIAPLEYPQATLPVPPYVFGLWLGSVTETGRHWLKDKDFNRMQIKVRQVGFTLTKKRKGEWLFSFRPSVRESFTYAGMMTPNMIPQSYLEADVDNRKLLLDGLFDSHDAKKVKKYKDGYSITDSWASIRRKQQLLEGLGYRTSLHNGRKNSNYTLFFKNLSQNLAMERRFVAKIEKLTPVQCVHITTDEEYVVAEGFLAVC